MTSKLETLLDWWQNSEVGRRHAEQAAAESQNKIESSRRANREKLASLQSNHLAAMAKLNSAVDAAQEKLDAAKKILVTAQEKLDAAKVDRHNCVARFDLESDRLRGEIASMPENAIVEFESWIEAEIQVLRKRKGSETSSEGIHDGQGKRTGERVVASDWHSSQRRMAGLVAARRQASELRFVVSADLDGEIAKAKAAIPLVVLEPIEQKSFTRRIREAVSL